LSPAAEHGLWQPSKGFAASNLQGQPWFGLEIACSSPAYTFKVGRG